MGQKQPPLVPGGYFHIYNRGNNRQGVFGCDADCDMFLEKWERFVTPVASTLAYNLRSNHFHAIIQVREYRIPVPPLLAELLTAEAVEQEFTKLFIGFARSRHNQYGTDGAVFKRPYQRKSIDDDEYLKDCTAYVLINAVIHGLMTDYRTDPRSSINAKDTGREIIDHQALLRLFGSDIELKNFLLVKQRQRNVRKMDNGDL